MNNLNSQQLAELLARKCAEVAICDKDAPCKCDTCQKFIRERTELILQSIPLVGLLELISIAEASLTNLEVLDMFPEQLALRNKCINLTNKLT